MNDPAGSEESPAEPLSRLESPNDETTDRLRPVGRRTLLLERNGIRIGLLGLMDPEELRSMPLPERKSWHVAEPEQSMKELLPELRAKSDLVVLLSQMSTAHTDDLLERVPGVDIALYGLRAPQEEDASRVGSTWVLRSGAKGQYLGHVTLELTRPHEIARLEVDTRALDARFETDPDWASRVQRGVAEADSARAEYLRRDQEAFEALFK
ncbi:MAG: hypothetical protein R3E97_07040 [Candidatus Eisenbacteria bacterium]